MTVERDLKRRAISALKWNYAGSAARAVSTFVAGVVLARLLGPKPFGQVAIATLIIGLGNLVADFGFSAALVQQKDLTDSDIRYAFTVQSLVGLVFTLMCVMFSRPLALMFHQSEVAPIIEVLGAMFSLQSLGQTATGLLKRQMNFKAIQRAQVLSYLIGYVGVGIPLAYFGRSAWALVFAQLVQTLLNSTFVYASFPHPVLPLLQHDGSMARFGTKVLGTNLLNWTVFNFDTVLAGRHFPAFQLGLYNRAFTLATTPATNFVSVIQSVLFSAVSRKQDHPDVYKQAYLGSLSIVAFAMLPLYASVAAAPSTVLIGLYGAKWVNAAPLLRIFCIAMCLHTLMALAGPLLWAINRVELELRSQAITLIATLIIFPICVWQSLEALAWGVVAIYALRFGLTTHALLREANLTWKRVECELRGAITLAIVAGLAVLALDQLLLNVCSTAPLRLVFEAIAGISIVVSAVRLVPSLVLGTEAIHLLDSVRHHLPSFVRRFVPMCSERHLEASV